MHDVGKGLRVHMNKQHISSHLLHIVLSALKIIPLQSALCLSDTGDVCKIKVSERITQTASNEPSEKDKNNSLKK